MALILVIATDIFVQWLLVVWRLTLVGGILHLYFLNINRIWYCFSLKSFGCCGVLMCTVKSERISLRNWPYIYFSTLLPWPGPRTGYGAYVLVCKEGPGYWLKPPRTFLELNRLQLNKNATMPESWTHQDFCQNFCSFTVKLAQMLLWLWKACAWGVMFSCNLFIPIYLHLHSWIINRQLLFFGLWQGAPLKEPSFFGDAFSITSESLFYT